MGNEVAAINDGKSQKDCFNIQDSKLGFLSIVESAGKNVFGAVQKAENFGASIVASAAVGLGMSKETAEILGKGVVIVGVGGVAALAAEQAITQPVAAAAAIGAAAACTTEHAREAAKADSAGTEKTADSHKENYAKQIIITENPIVVKTMATELGLSLSGLKGAEEAGYIWGNVDTTFGVFFVGGKSAVKGTTTSAVEDANFIKAKVSQTSRLLESAENSMVKSAVGQRAEIGQLESRIVFNLQGDEAAVMKIHDARQPKKDLPITKEDPDPVGDFLRHPHNIGLWGRSNPHDFDLLTICPRLTFPVVRIIEDPGPKWYEQSKK